VRDISALGSMPGMALLEPGSEHEVRAAVDWAVHRAPGSVYLRLVSVRWALPFEPPEVAELVPGRGTVVREGSDGLLVGAGPVMVGGAWHAAELLARDGLDFGVVSLPWLRDVDGAWLAGVADGAPIVTLDNHYLPGGQGDAVLAALAADAPEAAARVLKIGVEEIPKSGENNETLHVHRLDGEGIAGRVTAALRARV
jgi:transketolase